MTNTVISKDKIDAYEATHYRIRNGNDLITLRIGRYQPLLGDIFNIHGISCGVFITAYNPLGEIHDHEANLAAHQRLGDDLREVAPKVLDAEGADPTGKWPPEPSYFALGLDEDAALNLGSRYRQDAVVWVGADAVPQLRLLR